MPSVGGVERRSAVRDFLGTIATTAAASFLLLTELLLLGSISLNPRMASRHLHLQHRRFEDVDVDTDVDADPEAEDVAAPIESALLLRLRQQLLLLLLLETVFSENKIYY